jgi:oxysterol 7-alpha-hydroxylase
MTFIMNPLLYPYVIKHGKQLDFHEFSDQVAPVTFGYPPVGSGKFPGMSEHIQRSFHLLQGNNLNNLTESLMGNLMFVFRQDYLTGESEWRTESVYQLCNSIMFEATFLTLFGKPAHSSRHSGMVTLREDFVKFDTMFPLLIARIPISLLGGTKATRDKLINYFHPQRMSGWSNTSGFIKERAAVLEQYDSLGDVDKAGKHRCFSLCIHLQHKMFYFDFNKDIPNLSCNSYRVTLGISHTIPCPESLLLAGYHPGTVPCTLETAALCTVDVGSLHTP